MSKSASKRSKVTSSKPAASQYPTPFEKAPASIEPFLAQLDPANVYITHVDRTRPEYKRQIFLLSLLLNATITALLVWRVYVAVPNYLALAQTLLGYASSATVDTSNTTRKEQMWILLRRTLMMALDYLLFYFVVPWPMSFFLEQPGNPVTWRWKIRFEQREVVVRVSRNWSGDDLMNGVKQGEQNPFFKTRIGPAVDRQWMQKTGYLMMDGSWDLDFGLMQDAHTLVKQDKIKMEDLNMLVLVYQEGAGWLAWKFETERDAEEYKRRQMMEFKKTLSGMGKESLFWKWQEIVEQEREADGGFSPETQKRVATRVAEEFAKGGIDFDEVAKGVGGIEQIPAKAS